MLLKTGKPGIATFVLRNLEQQAVLRASEYLTILNKIRFEEEICDTIDLLLPSKTSVKPVEQRMANALKGQ